MWVKGPAAAAGVDDGKGPRNSMKTIEAQTTGRRSPLDKSHLSMTALRVVSYIRTLKLDLGFKRYVSGVAEMFWMITTVDG